MRGVDQTVSVPMPAEATAAREALKLDDTTLLFKLEIPGISSTSHYFVTSMPRATLYTPGACHPWLPGIQYFTGNTGFLEDSWRVDLLIYRRKGSHMRH